MKKKLLVAAVIQYNAMQFSSTTNYSLQNDHKVNQHLKNRNILLL